MHLALSKRCSSMLPTTCLLAVCLFLLPLVGCQASNGDDGQRIERAPSDFGSDATLTPASFQTPTPTAKVPTSTATRTRSPTATARTPASVQKPQIPAEIVVTYSKRTYPAGCGPGAVARFIVDFFDAYNRGDSEELANFFRPTFEWYSDTIEAVNPEESRPFVTRPGNREELLKYFAERHEQNERLRLLSLDMNYDADRNLINIGYLLSRQADDYKAGPNGPERHIIGKGVISCPEKKILVWSIGDPLDTEESEKSPSSVPRCPEPPGDAARDAVIACDRAWRAEDH